MFFAKDYNHENTSKLIDKYKGNIMNFNLQEAAKHVVADIRELASFNSDEKGAQRVAWTPVWQKSRTWFADKARQSGAAISVDAAGKYLGHDKRQKR